MNNKQELVYKPNQTIMITNKNISAMQRKAYNVILHKAYWDLKTDDRQTEFKFLISEIKRKAGLKATDNVKLKTSLTNLSKVNVEIVKDNGDWTVFNLISYAKKEGNYLIVELPKPIRESLIDNSFYTTLDLLIMKSLEGKYAIILYEIVIRYQKVEIPEMSIEDLKLLTGTENTKSYNNFGIFRQKVLTPAIKEINTKTDITLSYKEKTSGRKVVAIKFFIKLKNESEKLSEPKSVLSENRFTKTKANVPQKSNFNQRMYSEEYLESLYENVGK